MAFTMASVSTDESSQKRGAIRLVASGRVQGVGFRWFVVRAAEAADVVGWVRNREDGAVEVWAEGTDEALRVLEEAVRAGPRHARVERVERSIETATESFRAFGVRP